MGWSARNAAAVLLTVCMGLTAVACSGTPEPSPQDVPAERRGVKGGTLRIVNASDVDSLDPAGSLHPWVWGLTRLSTRTLYSWDSNASGDDLATPVPDLAEGRPEISSDGLVYTFRLRSGARWAQPVNREVTADDLVHAVERQANGQPNRNPYLPLIEGTGAFAAGEADRISGLEAVDRHTLRVTLTRPEPELLSIMALPYFAPVAREAVARAEQAGVEYGQRLVGSGPYTLEARVPGESITFVRNRNWDPASDPLRKAWVDRVEVRVGLTPEQIHDAIERHDADLNGDLVVPPVRELQQLATDPGLAPQVGVKNTGCLHYLTLRTDDGPTADPKVRRALNLLVDKSAVIRAQGGRFAGDSASTILNPAVGGYQRFDLYETAGFGGDPEAARALLEEAGFGDGLTLTYVGSSVGQGPAATAALERSLARGGVELEVTQYPGLARYEESLLRADRAGEHQIGDARWCPQWPGDGAQSVLVPLLHSRSITETNRTNHGSYRSDTVDELLDQALAAPERRAELWHQADRQAMQDGAVVPVMYERQLYFWSFRVKHWRFSPWTGTADYANLWLDPASL